MKKLLMAMLALVMMAGCSSETPNRRKSRSHSPSQRNSSPDGPPFRAFHCRAGLGARCQPYRIESMITDDSKGKEGTRVWRASFASPLQCSVKAYTWSGEVSSDRGINPGTEDTYSPTNTSTQIFERRLPQGGFRPGPGNRPVNMEARSFYQGT